MQVASDEHANIHRSLHRLLDTLKPDLDSAVKFGEGLIFEEEGARVVDRQAQLAVFDLRYTPRSLRSWDSLASASQPFHNTFDALYTGAAGGGACAFVKRTDFFSSLHAASCS